MGVFERATLSNGLRVLTAPQPHAQSVSCLIMLAAGSRYETAETNGIAHFAEHMFFKGTERRPTARDIAGEVDGIGGEFNAFTGKEYTGYYVRCAAATRDTALDVLVDMLRNSTFDPAEIEREKGVIVEEMNMYFDTPRDFIGGAYESLLYDDQPLGWDIIGRKETVRGATRETFLDYVDHWYRPARMVVGIGGQVGDGLLPRLEELLGDIEPRDTGSPAPVKLPANGSRVKVHTKQSDQAHLVLGVRSRPLVDPDRYVLQLLATVLGGGMSSRLFTEVRERRGLAYYVFGTNHAYTDAGSLHAQSGVDINRIDEAVTTIVEQFRLLASDAGARRRAREGAQLRQGPVRAPAREPARDDHVRPAPRGARGAGGRAGRGARRTRRRHRGGHPASRRRGARVRLPPRRDRAVRRRRALRAAARLIPASGFWRLARGARPGDSTVVGPPGGAPREARLRRRPAPPAVRRSRPGPLVARRGEVLVVAERGAPVPADRRERAHEHAAAHGHPLAVAAPVEERAAGCR